MKKASPSWNAIRPRYIFHANAVGYASWTSGSKAGVSSRPGRALFPFQWMSSTDLVDVSSHSAQERPDVLDRVGSDESTVVVPEADPQVV